MANSTFGGTLDDIVRKWMRMQGSEHEQGWLDGTQIKASDLHQLADFSLSILCFLPECQGARRQSR